MSKKEERQDDLDTETTFADMNVEGFRWYDPSKKKGGKQNRNVVKPTRKEYWAMVRGAFAALLPMILCIGIGALFMVFIAYLWLS